MNYSHGTAKAEEGDSLLITKNRPVFGRRYAIRSATVRVKRAGTKMNLEGGVDDVEYDGQELAFFIKDEEGIEQTFLEARLRHSSISVHIAKPGVAEALRKLKVHHLQPCAIDFTLQELAEHFNIPEVPDVTTMNPEGYKKNLELLEQIEALCP